MEQIVTFKIQKGGGLKQVLCYNPSSCIGLQAAHTRMVVASNLEIFRRWNK